MEFEELAQVLAWAKTQYPGASLWVRPDEDRWIVTVRRGDRTEVVYVPRKGAGGAAPAH